MTTFRRTALTGATITAISLLAVACTSTPEAEEPSASPAPTCEVDESALGAATPGELIDSGSGSYCHVTADLESIEFTAFDDVRVGTWSADDGIVWSEGEPSLSADLIAEAQRLSAQWTVEEFLDGEAIEMTADEYAEWIRGTELIGEDWRADYLAGWENEKKTNGLTVAPFTTPLARDAQARVSDVSLTPYSTSALDVEGRQYVETCFDVTATYTAADSAGYPFSGRVCSTFETDGSTVTYALEGTHGNFVVSDESGAVVASEDYSG